MGNVTAESSNYGVGGIFGGNSKTHNYEATLAMCVNFGTISTAGKYASGIYGGCTASGQEESIYPVITLSNCYNAGAVENATDKKSAFLNVAYAAAVPATILVEKCYTAVAVDYCNIDEAAGAAIASSVGACEVASIIEAVNATTDMIEIYVKDGEVLVCDAHDYKDGVCKNCGAEDPNYVPPQPEDPKPEDPKPEDPAPTSDITVYALAIALVSLAGVVVAKKKIRE